MGLTISFFRYSTKFSNNTNYDLNFALILPYGKIENSANFPIHPLRAGGTCPLYHRLVHNYSRSVPGFQIKSWIVVDGNHKTCLLDPTRILHCDEVKFRTDKLDDLHAYYDSETDEDSNISDEEANEHGKPDNVGVAAQPPPVSGENLTGTDWQRVTTVNDGKGYYYNTKTKESSWQVPKEVTHLQEKQKVETLKEQSTPTSRSSPSTVAVALEANGSGVVESTVKSIEDKVKDSDRGGGSDSNDEDSGPSKEECINQFKVILKECGGVTPSSEWEKEHLKAIPSHIERRELFEHYVRTPAEEERKEKHAAQRDTVEGFDPLLEEVKEHIDHNTSWDFFYFA